MKVDAMKCLNCDTTIWSKHRHDFQYCSCKECFIDGGRDYTRGGFTKAETVIKGTLDTKTNEFTPYKN